MRETALKVLLVEDNPGDARLLEESLKEDAGDGIQLECVRALAPALELVSNTFFDAILLDLGLPDSTGFDTFAKMRTAAAEVPVVVLTGLEDEEIGLKTIQQGAQDYLAKNELTGGLLARSLRYSVERHRNSVRERQFTKPTPAGKAVGFLGVKGGVGTTTVALNTAALLVKNTNHLITAVELNPHFGSFSSHLRESPAHHLGTLQRMAPDTISNSVLEKCLMHSRFGFEVLFSPQTQPDFFEPDTASLRPLLERLASRSDLLLLDIARQHQETLDAALPVCDILALVMERDPSSLAAAGVMLSSLRQRDILSAVKIVIVNRTLLIDGASPKQIEEKLQCEILGVVPPAPEIAVGAQRSGCPMALHRPLSAPATMLNGIARKLEDLISPPVPARSAIPVLQSISA